MINNEKFVKEKAKIASAILNIAKIAIAFSKKAKIAVIAGEGKKRENCARRDIAFFHGVYIVCLMPIIL